MDAVLAAALKGRVPALCMAALPAQASATLYIHPPDQAMSLLAQKTSKVNAFQRIVSKRPILRAAPRLTSAVKAMASLQVAVKGDPSSSTLLDCPFCQRVLLTLETKNIPYTKEYIDFDHKPEWLLEKADGKVPVIHQDDFWLADSDKIVEYLEQQYPEPSMASNVPADVTSNFFGAFRNLLFAKPEEVNEKKGAFVAELTKLNNFLAQGGPFFGGAHLDATDASLAPKLYHALVALGHFKGLTLDADKFPAVERYRQALKDLPAWKNTDYGPEAVIKGWARHMQQ